MNLNTVADGIARRVTTVGGVQCSFQCFERAVISSQFRIDCGRVVIRLIGTAAAVRSLACLIGNLIPVVSAVQEVSVHIRNLADGHQVGKLQRRSVRIHIRSALVFADGAGIGICFDYPISSTIIRQGFCCQIVPIHRHGRITISLLNRQILDHLIRQAFRQVDARNRFSVL